jgi:regulator of protease activity HflC (stomatin/prohibitin superfamily)
MLDLIVSPIYKLLAAIAAVALIFFAGYYKGYVGERDKLVQFKAQIEAQAESQAQINKAAAEKQAAVTQGIVNEYKARLANLRNLSNRLPDPGTGAVPAVPSSTQGAFKAPSYPVLTGQCLETTLMLTTLQEWVKSVSN